MKQINGGLIKRWEINILLTKIKFVIKFKVVYYNISDITP